MVGNWAQLRSTVRKWQRSSGAQRSAAGTHVDSTQADIHKHRSSLVETSRRGETRERKLFTALRAGIGSAEIQEKVKRVNKWYRGGRCRVCAYRYYVQMADSASSPSKVMSCRSGYNQTYLRKAQPYLVESGSADYAQMVSQ